MSANLVRLRKRAAELEQKKQFDRALEVYVQILDEGGKDLDDEDVPLFNRVGDMLMRKGSVTEALGYYERAVDMYAERGYLNNAIALCSKILRQSPGRAAVYYKLARISARKGFKSDARKNFLEYADRMQKLGMADEAFRALKEFASLYPDQDDVRLVLAELLSKENRKGEALEQLQSLYQKLQSEGRAAEARATVDRMRSIDPSVTPREGALAQTPAAGDLVFLDLSDAESSPDTPNADNGQPASARAPLPTPVPALTGLSITFLPGEAEPPHPEGFESTSVEPEPVDMSPVTRSLTPLGTELVVEPASPSPGRPSEPDVEAVAPVEMPAREPAALERVEEALEDLLPEPEAATTQDDGSHAMPPLSSFEFGDLDLDDAPRGHALRAHDLPLPGELPVTPDEVDVVDESSPVSTVAVDEPEPEPAEVVHAPSPASDAAAEDARTAAEEAAALAADVAAREAVQQTLPETWQPPSPPELPDESARETGDGDVAPNLDALVDGDASTESAVAVPDDFMALPPSFGAPAASEDDHAFPPLVGLEDDSIADEDEDEVAVAGPAELSPPVPTPRGTISIGSAESHLRSRLELDHDNWELRRQLGEALLDNGDRDGGLYELELAMVGFEVRGDMDRAQEVVDEILSVSPGSVAHHQKRVEYAVRSRDRARLTHSYLELADALFRTGAGDKAVAVYTRVLELDHDNERAEFALATLAPDELVRLRGGPGRPDRWTDELATIDDDRANHADRPAPADGARLPDEEPAEAAPADGTPGAAKEPAAPSRVRFRSLDFPVPDWGEGVPVLRAADAEPAMNEPAVEDGIVAEAPPSTAYEWLEDEEGPPSMPAPRSRPEFAPQGEPSVEDGAEAAAPEPRTATPESLPTPRSATPVSQPGTSTPSSTTKPPAPWFDPAPTTPLSVQGQHDAARDDEPPSQHPTPRSAPSPRTPTPRPVPVVETGRALAASDSDYIDLGEWLRDSEPTRSTRMQVKESKPTGDEQADFEEMLRRFKRGVAENVEAEDYEAHYDLGVAFKEMGLIDEAIAQFQKALRDPAQRVRSYEALGQCFVEKQQYPIAAALLQRATEVPGTDDQQLVAVLYLLGFATEHLGRPAEALPYYLRVFAVDIEFRDIAERVAALGKLTK